MQTACSQPSAPEPQTEVLRVALKNAPPFVMSERGHWKGVAVELWHEMSLELNRPYVLIPYHTVEEVLNAVANGKADIGIGPLSITADREAKLDFTQGFFNGGIGIITVKKADSVLAGLLAVFNWELLRALAGLATVLLIFGGLIWWLERKHNPGQFGGPTLGGIGQGFWWSAVTMTTVGYGDKAPVTFWGRMVGVVWMFVSVITISSFTAAITSSITLSNLKSRVNSVAELSSVRVGVVRTTSSSLFLNSFNVKYQSYENIDQALDALEKGKLDAVVHDLPILKYLVAHRDTQGLVVLAENLHTEPYGFVLPEGSRLREPINRALLQTLDSSHWQRIRENYFQ